MSLQTLNDILFAVCSNRRDRVMLQRGAQSWTPISSTEIYRGVVGIARALEAWGVRKGDRVAILSENRPEWTITDFALLALGAVTVPIYATQTAEHIAFILNDSGARVVFLSSAAQLKKVISIREHPSLEKIVVFDRVQDAGAVCMEELWPDGTASRVHQIEADAGAVTPDDLATIIYTSGTTGTPKGVMLTHGNMASNLNCSLIEFPVQQDDVSISFLPLSHVTARHVDFALLYRGVTLAHLALELLSAGVELARHLRFEIARVSLRLRRF